MKKNQKPNHNDAQKAIIDSLTWTILTSFLGLSQVWLTFLLSKILIEKNYYLLNAVKDGTLLSFIIALVIAITIDHHFSQISAISQRWRSYIFTFFPMIICGLATSLYATRYIVDTNQLNQNSFAIAQYIILIMTIAYAFVAKSIMFYYQEDNK